MKKDIRFVGLDVRAETIVVAAAEADGEARSLGVIPNRPETVRRLVKKVGPAESLQACYEAGPCGYVLYWQLSELGVHCDVVAPTLVPVKSGDRIKTDRRAALKLARSYRSGDLTPVWPESDLFENWNRHYDPAVGRYLQPDPILLNPAAAITPGGSLPISYSYAGSNPVDDIDPKGLHDTNGCQYGSSCDDCKRAAETIAYAPLKECVLSKCSGKEPKLYCDPKSKEKASCGKPVAEGFQAAAYDEATGKILWCESPLQDLCQGKLLVHELAHACQWKMGQGVPDYRPDTPPELDLRNCHPTR